MNGSVADETAGVCGARAVPGSQRVLTLTERVVRRSRLDFFKVGRVCPQRAVACRKSRAVASSRRAEDRRALPWLLLAGDGSRSAP